MPFRKTPVPLAAAALLLAAWVAAASSGKLTPATCDADYRDLLNEIERNRSKSVHELSAQIAEATSDHQRAGLKEQREQAWDAEEAQRGQAKMIWRDCMRAAKGETG